MRAWIGARVTRSLDGMPTSMSRASRLPQLRPSYKARVWENAVHPAWLPALARAARAVYSREKDTTFWINSSATPRGILESFALHTLRSHMKASGYTPDRITSSIAGRSGKPFLGAEWWIQQRIESAQKKGIEWHCDEDIDLAERKGVSLSPSLATVTYLTSYGAPLVLLSTPTFRQYSDGSESSLEGLGSLSPEVYVSHPVAGKHLAFDGRLLHGVPTDDRIQHLAGERLSLMVNLWVGRQPSMWRSGRWEPPALGGDEDDGPAISAPVGPLCLGHAAVSDVIDLTSDGINGKCLDIFDLDIECGPWKIEGAVLPLRMDSVQGLRCVRLSRGALRARYLEEGWS